MLPRVPRCVLAAALLAAACTPPHAKLPHEDDAYAALNVSCRPRLDPELAVRMLRSPAPEFWVYVSFASWPRGSMWERGDRERFASCTDRDCVAFMSRDRINKLCDDGNVREISGMPER